MPRKRFPIPIGQVIGAVCMLRFFSMSSSSSNGSCPSRSSLFMKVMIGVWRRRQTSSSFLVWVSTPLTESITIRTESTAVSTR